MIEVKQKLYRVSCHCGGYHWVRKRKASQDVYMCVQCHSTFKAQDKERNQYVIRGTEVFKKNGKIK